MATSVRIATARLWRGGGGGAGAVGPGDPRLRGDPLVGYGPPAVALPHDQRLQAEGILGEAEGVLRGGELADAPVEVPERRQERLAQGGALGEPPGEVDADDLGVVLGVEADALLLVDPAQLVVIRDVPVVDDGEGGGAVRPERLGVGEGDPAL